MSINFAIIGGDSRIVELTKILSKDGNIIYTYGLEKAQEIKKNKNIKYCKKICDAINEKTKVVIGPIPFSRDKMNLNAPFSQDLISIQELKSYLKDKLLIAGAIPTEIEGNIVDVMKREELAVLNSISTAEGAIEIAISNTKKTLHGSSVLILGFGRIAKVLARKLYGLSVIVTCAARSNEHFSWINACGYKATNINLLNDNLAEYDIIINTVPHMILTSNRIKYIKKDCLLIDLASTPGGIDIKAAEKAGLKSIWALALPGKVAPITTAEFIKQTIYNILKEEKIINTKVEEEGMI